MQEIAYAPRMASSKIERKFAVLEQRMATTEQRLSAIETILDAAMVDDDTETPTTGFAAGNSTISDTPVLVSPPAPAAPTNDEPPTPVNDEPGDETPEQANTVSGD